MLPDAGQKFFVIGGNWFQSLLLLIKDCSLNFLNDKGLILNGPSGNVLDILLTFVSLLPESECDRSVGFQRSFFI